MTFRIYYEGDYGSFRSCECDLVEARNELEAEEQIRRRFKDSEAQSVTIKSVQREKP